MDKTKVDVLAEENARMRNALIAIYTRAANPVTWGTKVCRRWVYDTALNASLDFAPDAGNATPGAQP
jgi:hypothetical protein